MISVITRTARKAHHCAECGSRIEPGERYHSHVASPNDGELGNETWWRLKECASCAARYGRPVTPKDRCEQCGRVGFRGFRTIHVEPLVRDGVTLVSEHDFTQCASRTACMKRWPKRRADDE